MAWRYWRGGMITSFGSLHGSCGMEGRGERGSKGKWRRSQQVGRNVSERRSAPRRFCGLKPGMI